MNFIAVVQRSKESGGSTTNKQGKRVWESARMLGRLKLHYVAMTRPTHLLCLAMRKDAFGEGELDTLASRGWTIIDCCAPDQSYAAPFSSPQFPECQLSPFPLVRL